MTQSKQHITDIWDSRLDEVYQRLSNKYGSDEVIQYVDGGSVYHTDPDIQLSLNRQNGKFDFSITVTDDDFWDFLPEYFESRESGVYSFEEIGSDRDIDEIIEMYDEVYKLIKGFEDIAEMIH
jgi:hypothetical protein